MMPAYVPVLRGAWRTSGLSAQAIAELAGISENTVYLVMGGRRKVRIDSVLAIASVLRVQALPVGVPLTSESASPTSNRPTA